jgi:alpha-tubulin suppressor-like RCC1 family protein
MKMRYLRLLLLVGSIIMVIWSPAAAASPKSLISAGDEHTLAIRKDGSLWAWGRDDFGQLGLGDTIERHTPTRVGTGINWVAVTAGSTYSLGLKADGSRWAWGLGSHGQLGLGTADNNPHPNPTRVGNDYDWVTVSAGFEHALAVKADGSLYAWGSNYFGELGLEIPDSHILNPSKVVTGTKWAAIDAGDWFSVGLKADGSFWAWGWNSHGQLGLGNTTNRFSPTKVWPHANPGLYLLILAN